jgi:ABC-2 type transport system permease protein
VAGLLFIPSFFLNDRAEMRNFFQLLPLLFCFFIPAVTMRSFAEERHTGSFETLLTLPVSLPQIVSGKILASTVFTLIMISPTLIWAIAIIIVGSPDIAPMVGAYLGAVLLALAYCSVGVFASALTRNQIVAWMASFGLMLFLTLVDKFLVFLPGFMVNLFENLSADFHFRNIARGVIDSRDVIYFCSLVALSVIGSIRILEERR